MRIRSVIVAIVAALGISMFTGTAASASAAPANVVSVANQGPRFCTESDFPKTPEGLQPSVGIRVLSRTATDSNRAIVGELLFCIRDKPAINAPGVQLKAFDGPTGKQPKFQLTPIGFRLTSGDDYILPYTVTTDPFPKGQVPGLNVVLYDGISKDGKDNPRNPPGTPVSDPASSFG